MLYETVLFIVMLAQLDQQKAVVQEIKEVMIIYETSGLLSSLLEVH